MILCILTCTILIVDDYDLVWYVGPWDVSWFQTATFIFYFIFGLIICYTTIRHMASHKSRIKSLIIKKSSYFIFSIGNSNMLFMIANVPRIMQTVIQPNITGQTKTLSFDPSSLLLALSVAGGRSKHCTTSNCPFSISFQTLIRRISREPVTKNPSLFMTKVVTPGWSNVARHFWWVSDHT